MQKVLYFDVEYANSKNRSICQVGLLSELLNGETFYPSQNIYINPEDGFDRFCTEVHHITFDMVKNKPLFPDVWKNIAEYFDDAIIIGHNIASADLNSLSRTLKRYNLKAPCFKYICTLDLARQYIPSSEIKSYKLKSICEYFGIDINNFHNAFEDAKASSYIFKALVKKYNIDINNHIKEYQLNNDIIFKSFIDDYNKINSIAEFYGQITWFEFNNKILKKHLEYLIKWKIENIKYLNYIEFYDIIAKINKITKKETITSNDILKLKCIVKKYIKDFRVNTSTITIRILIGILKSIILDSKITLNKLKNFKNWLDKYPELRNHYPFEQVTQLIESILNDNIITKQTSDFIKDVIKKLLNPLSEQNTTINEIKKKHICLTGNFSHGSKSVVEKLLINDGGIIDRCVNKNTDILIIGDYGSNSYAFGHYGLKIQKAIDYNCNGANIHILKEKEFFAKTSSCL